MKTRYLSGLLAIMLLFALAACQKTTNEKTIVKSGALWPEFTFEEACDQAQTIVIGTVSNVAAAKEYRLNVPGPKESYNAYTDITIKIEEMLKGEVRTESIVYTQSGGETKDTIYVLDGIEPFGKGDRVLIFLNERNSTLSPSFRFVIDDNSNILPYCYPADYLLSETAMNSSIPVSDYAALITDYLSK